MDVLATRRALGITNRQLAELAGLSRGVVIRAEKNQNTFYTHRLRIEQVLQDELDRRKENGHPKVTAVEQTLNTEEKP